MPTTARRTFEMLESQTLWVVAAHVHEALAARGIDHAVVGGVATCLHGYRRNTVDLDLLIRPADAEKLRSTLESLGISWKAGARTVARRREWAFRSSLLAIAKGGDCP